MTMMNILLRSLNYKYSFIIMFITSIIIIIITSHYLGTYTMKLSNKTAEKIYKKIGI